MAVKLEDTCLCAIVRDEVINPVGGILDFVKLTVPHVESAIIVDTGSVDGTREILKDCEGRHSNLKIYDRKFRGFADVRNYSLKKGKKAKSKYCFVLDADKGLTERDFGDVADCMNANSYDVYEFYFKHIQANGERGTSSNWLRRLFRFWLKPLFKRELWEGLHYNFTYNVGPTAVYIKHFLPSPKGIIVKSRWYDEVQGAIDTNTVKKMATPSSHEDFHLWKEVNPHRESFR